jgi:hypothetical protein
MFFPNARCSSKDRLVVGKKETVRNHSRPAIRLFVIMGGTHGHLRFHHSRSSRSSTETIKTKEPARENTKQKQPLFRYQSESAIHSSKMPFFCPLIRFLVVCAISFPWSMRSFTLLFSYVFFSFVLSLYLFLSLSHLSCRILLLLSISHSFSVSPLLDKQTHAHLLKDNT